MRMGIIGSGQIGVVLSRLGASAGHEVLLSYSRDPQRLPRAATTIGPALRAGRGDDAGATTLVAGLVQGASYDAYEAGGLEQAARQEPGGPLYGRELTAAEIGALR